jgi:SdrD B-like domain
MNPCQGVERPIGKSAFAAFASTLLMATALLPTQLASAAPTAITGVVFEDWNQSGVHDGVEPGIGGVTVTATSDSGVVVTTTTAPDGTYTLNGVSGMQRVEFTGAPAWMFPAPHGTGVAIVNNTTVQFVATGDTANAAFADPADYAQSNPNFVLPRQLDGDRSASTAVALHQYPWNVSGNAGITPSTDLGKMNEVGTTYGVGWDRLGKQLFLGAFVKRHAGLKSDGSGNAMPGAIYRVDYTNSASPSRPILWTTVSGVGSVANDSTRGLSATPAIPNRDPDLMSLVGKAGLGDIEVSPDGKSLYAVNLASQQLVTIDIATKSQTTTSLPAYSCTSGVNRPFALAWHHGKLLVGATCTGEFGGTAANLSANVWEFTPGTGFTATPLLGAAGIAIDYPRGDSAGNGGPRNNGPFNPWTDDFSIISATSIDRGTYRQIGYPMPLLSDIEFTDAGAMILGFRDRTGDLTGVNNYAPTGTSTTLYDGVTGGETLQLNKVGGTWILESPLNATTETFKDNYAGGEHFETTQGALATLRGTGTIVSTLMDPAQFGTGGAKFFDATGNGTRILTNFAWYGSTPGYFGKANGLGDIEALVDAAPIEIGNRIWIDEDGDGVQDASDPGIGGVVVKLYKAGVLVGTTTTLADGTYYFNSSNVAGGIVPNAADYEIRIEDATGVSQQSALTKLRPTTANAASNASDTFDSDAVADATTPSTLIIAVLAASIATPGQNNHTFDAGFVRNYSLGNRVWLDNGIGGGVSNDGIQSGGELGIDGVKVSLYAADSTGNPSGPALDTQTTALGGYYRFDNIAPGDYVVVVDKAGSPALNNLASSTGVAASTAAQGTDKDDNGIDAALGAMSVLPGGIASAKITIGPGMPTGETDLPIGGATDPATDATSNQTIDFGFAPSYSLGNRVWFDTNNDGMINGTEFGVPGVKVSLLDSLGNPIAGQMTTTDANGYYRFDGLSAGSYKVLIDPSNFLPAGPLVGYGSSTPTALDPNTDVDSDDNGLQPATPGAAKTVGIVSGLVTVDATTAEPTTEIDIASPNPAGEAPNSRSNLTVDFGFFKTAIGNTVWYDTNNDGIMQASEPKLEGVVVNLVDASTNAIIGTAITDVNGYYQIIEATTGNPLPVGVSVKIVIPSGQTVLAGTEPSTPTSTVDSNNHGVLQGNGDTASAAFTITPGVTTGGQIVSNRSASTINPTLDFGFNAPLASLGDKVWVDTNSNGVQDSGEPGVAGVVVELLDAGGAVLKSVTTDANGNYKFVDLKPGTYSVRFVPTSLPSGAKFTGQNAGTDDALNSDADPTTGRTKQYTLVKRQYQPSVDAGIVVPIVNSIVPVDIATPTTTPAASGTNSTAPTTVAANNPTSTPATPTSVPAVSPKGRIAATVWIDANRNGTFDQGEAPVSGAEVIITGPNGFTKTVRTDANGNYDVGNLAPGQYSVEVTGNGIDPSVKLLTARKVSVTVFSDQITVPTAEFALAPSNLTLALTGVDLTLLRIAMASIASGLLLCCLPRTRRRKAR